MCNSTRQIHQAMSMKSMAGSASTSTTFIGSTQYPVNVASKSLLPFADGLGDHRPHLCIPLALWLVYVMIVSLSPHLLCAWDLWYVVLDLSPILISLKSESTLWISDVRRIVFP